MDCHYKIAFNHRSIPIERWLKNMIVSILFEQEFTYDLILYRKNWLDLARVY